MSEGTLLLVLAYVALTALLVTALIATRLPLLVKAILTLTAVGLYAMSYLGWQSAQGWGQNCSPWGLSWQSAHVPWRSGRVVLLWWQSKQRTAWWSPTSGNGVRA